MKTFFRRLLGILIVLIVLTGFVWLVAFSVVTVPAADESKPQRALVLTWFRKSAIEPGALVLVELDTDSGKTRSIRRVQQIRLPDPSERPRATRAIGQALLDMDYKPKYGVTMPVGPATNDVEVVTQRRLKGVVVHLFGARN
ncbi:MAG TPA: hypothetical protein VK530_15660 [Candidatus Acidoferrum sp.]|nr:hypothetical protein [Candidatus Acidoferrum sp.]